MSTVNANAAPVPAATLAGRTRPATADTDGASGAAGPNDNHDGAPALRAAAPPDAIVHDPGAGTTAAAGGTAAFADA